MDFECIWQHCAPFTEAYLLMIRSRSLVEKLSILGKSREGMWNSGTALLTCASTSSVMHSTKSPRESTNLTGLRRFIWENTIK